MSIFKNKKIINLSVLIIILFSLFSFTDKALAGMISISTKNLTISTGESANIEAYILQTGGRTIQFSSTPSGTFNPTSCQVDNYDKNNDTTGTCSVSFSSNAIGTYKINATLQKTLTSPEIKSAPIIIKVIPAEKWWAIFKKVRSDGSFQGCYSIQKPSLDTCREAVKIAAGIRLIPSLSAVDPCVKQDIAPTNPSECSLPIVPDGSTASTTTAKTETDYYPLATLPGVGEKCAADSTGKIICVKTTPTDCTTDAQGNKTCTPSSAFGTYLNAMIKIFIGICAILALIMIVFGGIQYMTSGLVSSKLAAKDTITNAILGLLLALGAFAILNTINPDLLGLNLNKMETVAITIKPGQIDTGYTSSSSSSLDLTKSPATCTKTGGKSSILSTARSFTPHTSYSKDVVPPWGWNATDNTIYLDCSAFVNIVYDCVGLNPPAGVGRGLGITNADSMSDTSNKNAEKIDNDKTNISKGIINGTALEAGDVLGWPSGKWSSLGVKGGHVVLSTGGTGTIEVSGEYYPNKLNTMAREGGLSDYGAFGANKTNLYTYIIRVKNIGAKNNSASSTNNSVKAAYNITTKKVTINVTDNDFKNYTYDLSIRKGSNTGEILYKEVGTKIPEKDTTWDLMRLYKNDKLRGQYALVGIYKNRVGVSTIYFNLN